MDEAPTISEVTDIETCEVAEGTTTLVEDVVTVVTMTTTEVDGSSGTPEKK